MIRKNLLLCKIFRVKTSSKFLFDSYMAKFQPRLETCPICGSTGNCHIHDYYGRSIIDFRSGAQEKSNLCVLWVFCDSCTMHIPSFPMPSSLTPATVCSLSCASSVNTLPYFAPLNSSAKDMESPKTSFSNGLPFSKPTSRNGSVFWLMQRFPIFHS